MPVFPTPTPTLGPTGSEAAHRQSTYSPLRPMLTVCQHTQGEYFCMAKARRADSRLAITTKPASVTALLQQGRGRTAKAGSKC